MQEGFLWAIDHCGQAHTISTSEQFWQLRSHHFLGHRLGFKRLTAGKHSAWGLSIDLNLYVYVYTSDVHIRFLEFTFENQRWTPIHGFSEKGLVFTDPPAFSNEKGSRKLPRPSEIKLPNEHWQWEGNWRVEGETAGAGWRYGSRFNHPERFYPEKHLTSWIRRRKWIRYRRYIARERWAQVPGVYPNESDPPLVYLAAGGYDLPGQSPGYMSLWVITADGKLFCRVGISHKHPEGVSWREVSLPTKVGLLQVSVSPTGIVWAVTHDGLGLVRTQVSREYPLGLGWEVVEPPESQLLSQVTIGMNAIWALTKDNTVWFRQGFDLMLSITDRKALTGSYWVRMPGTMSHLSIGPNDQVWAISFIEHRLYMRGAVTYEELSGRSWRLINVTDKVDRTISSIDGQVPSQNYRHSPLPNDQYRFLMRTNSQSFLSPTDSILSLNGGQSFSTPRNFFSPPGSLSYFSFSPTSLSQGNLSYLSLMDQNNRSMPGSQVSSAETFKSGQKEFRHFSCQTVDMHPTGSASSSETLSSMEQGVSNNVRSVFQTRRNALKRQSFVKESGRTNLYPKLDRSHSCDLLSELDLDGQSVEHGAPRRHSIGDVVVCAGLVGAHTTVDHEDDPFTSSTEVDRAKIDLEASIKSYGTLQRQASWRSYDSNEDDKICNFVDSESSDSDEVEVRSVETQTDILNFSGNSTVSLSSGHEDESSEPGDDSLFGPSSSQENLINRAVFDHFQRDTLKRQMSSPYFGGTEDPWRNTSIQDRVLWGPTTKPMNQNYSPNEPYANPLYLTVDTDPQDLRYEPFDENDDCNKDLLWVWVCGGSCWVKPTSLPKWFTNSNLSQASFKHRLKEGDWRDHLLSSLKKRREDESDQFSHYLSAVDRTPWVKSGSIQWQSDGRKRPWLDAIIELEKSEAKKRSSTVKITCSMYGRTVKKIQLPVSDITCVLEVSNSDKPTFSLHTAKTTEQRKPVKLRVRTEEELRDWLVALSLACTDVQDLPATPHPYAMWCTTCRGDIFYHQPRPNTETAPANTMYWQHIGGHLHVIESCPAGITWGIGMDHAVWVYTGGYGGGIFKGVYSSTSGIYDQTDTTKVYLFENQRWSPLYGFSERHELWMQESGKMEESRDSVSPPSAQWQWSSEWQIDFSVKGSTDKEGWQYARDFKSRNKPRSFMDLPILAVPWRNPDRAWGRRERKASGRTFHKEKRWNDGVRRRRWIRTCQLVTTGPWRRAKGLDLMDMSLQVDTDVSWNGPIAVWALGTNGDVMTRIGVTRNNPMGSSWYHIPTDQPFQSISIGGKFRVWGIGKDGSAFFRNGINVDNVTGAAWFHVSAPTVAPLKQISVGATTVWAVDTKKNLWFRQDVTPNFPEGTRWILVCSKVRQVSVGPQDQVWMLADAMDNAKGVICRRDGINPSLPQGKTWNKGAGGGILHLSVRGCLPVPFVKKTSDTGDMVLGQKGPDP